MRQYKKFTEEDYKRVHELAYEYQDGNKEAGEELLKLFSAFLNKYVSLLSFGYFDLENSSIRKFIKLFIENQAKSSAITSYKHNKGLGTCIASETVEKIKRFFSSLTKEDIQQEVSNIFLVMASKYKDTKPSFQNHIDKNFHFYAYRHFEKLTRDPLSRGEWFNESKVTVDSLGDSFVKDVTCEIIDEQYEIDINDKEIEIAIEQIKKSSKIPCIGDKKSHTSVYDDSFLDINWINGITCSEVFQSLTPFERRIIVMWYMEKKTDSQIADEFGVCRGTINNKRLRAKEKLKQDIKRLNLHIK